MQYEARSRGDLISASHSGCLQSGAAQGTVSRRGILKSLSVAGMGMGLGISTGTVTLGSAGEATFEAGSSLPTLPTSAAIFADSSGSNPAEPFGYSLNTATIMGFKLPVPEQISIAAKAGYQGIELWIRDIEQFVSSGKSLKEIRKQIEDSGLQVTGAIGFCAWAAEDDSQRAKALEQLRREMDWVSQVGGKTIAAPPAGINQIPNIDLRRIAERYRTILELGELLGVVPQLEIWGASLNLSRVSEALFVAIECGHPRATVLLDAYHMYRGGSSFESLRLVNGAAMTLFHLNDYPADPPREKITDAYRVFPGDGVAPLSQLLRLLHETGFRGMLSLELFNRQYWQGDPLEVAKLGLAKMKTSVRNALEAT